jgi:hypothetical protein
MEPGAFGPLVTALRREVALTEEVRDALLRQRAAVAVNDTEAVVASIRSIEAALLALGEARRLRASVLAALTGDPTLPLAHLETLRREPLPLAVEEARRALRRAAEAARRDGAINQAVLARAQETGEAFLLAFFSSAAGETPTTYAAADRSAPAEAPRGVLLNRRA